MYLKASQLMRKKIIAVKEDKEIGVVKDFVYDPDKNQITGLLVDLGDILAEAKVLPFSEIHEINLEMVLAKSEKSIKPASKAVSPATKSDNSDDVMQGAAIQSAEGGRMGNFRDLIFDTKSGKVIEFELKEGTRSKRIPVKEVVASTDKVTVVKENNNKKENGILAKITDMMGI